MPTLILAGLLLTVTALVGIDPQAQPAQQAPSHPVVETPCFEDEIGMVMDYRFEPQAHQRGYWDGDRYFRLCVPVDNLTVVDGELVPHYEN